MTTILVPGTLLLLLGSLTRHEPSICPGLNGFKLFVKTCTQVHQIPLALNSLRYFQRPARKCRNLPHVLKKKFLNRRLQNIHSEVFRFLVKLWETVKTMKWVLLCVKSVPGRLISTSTVWLTLLRPGRGSKFGTSEENWRFRMKSSDQPICGCFIALPPSCASSSEEPSSAPSLSRLLEVPCSDRKAKSARDAKPPPLSPPDSPPASRYVKSRASLRSNAAVLLPRENSWRKLFSSYLTK